MNTDIQLTKHFHLREFLHNGSDEGLTPGIVDNLRKLANELEDVRKLLGDRPMTITSGYRSPAHNRKVGGAPQSFHLRGLAADFVVQGLTPQKVQEILKEWPGGMELAPTWTHLDLGPRRRFYP